MRISIVIPNYNGAQLLEQNLPAVIAAAEYYQAKTKDKVEIVVTDDHSVDDSLQVLQRFAVKVVEHAKNTGFASNVNRGVKKANGEIIVLLNTDVKPEKDFLLPLLKRFTNEKVFAVGCMDKSVEGKQTVLRGRGVGKWQRGFLMHARGEVNRDTTLWVSGGSGAFRKTIWDRLQGFDELYSPFYWEDIDLSYRAAKSGYTIYFEKDSVVTHEHEKGAIKKSASAKRITTVAYRNQFIFTWKNMTDLSLWIRHITWLPYHFVKALLRGDIAFFAGFFHAFFLLPNIIQSSMKARKLFIKTDSTTVQGVRV